MVSVPLLCYQTRFPPLLPLCWFPQLGWSHTRVVAPGRVQFQRCSWHLGLVCAKSATLGPVFAALVGNPTSEIQDSIWLAFSKTARSLLPGEQLKPAWAPSLAGLALFISSRKLMRGWVDLSKYLRGRVNPGKELSCSGRRMMLALEQTGLT